MNSNSNLVVTVVVEEKVGLAVTVARVARVKLRSMGKVFPVVCRIARLVRNKSNVGFTIQCIQCIRIPYDFVNLIGCLPQVIQDEKNYYIVMVLPVRIAASCSTTGVFQWRVDIGLDLLVYCCVQVKVGLGECCGWWRCAATYLWQKSKYSPWLGGLLFSKYAQTSSLASLACCC